MMRAKYWLLLALTILLLGLGWATFLDPSARLVGVLKGDAFFAGTSATGWALRLSTGDDLERSQAAAELTEGASAAVPVLKQCLKAENSEARWRSAEILGKIGEPALQAMAALIERLDDPDPLVADVAAQTLAGMGPVAAPDSVPALIKKFPRTEFLRAVAKFGPAGAPATEALIACLADPDSIARWNAVRTLGKIKAVSAVQPIMSLLADPSPEVREHAAEALGDIGPAAAIAAPDLVKLFTDPMPRVRRDSVRSMGQFGPVVKPHLKAVQQLQDDPDPDVREAAKRAARLIDPTLAK